MDLEMLKLMIWHAPASINDGPETPGPALHKLGHLSWVRHSSRQIQFSATHHIQQCHNGLAGKVYASQFMQDHSTWQRWLREIGMIVAFQAGCFPDGEKGSESSD